jgi:hypothetical protein
MDCENPRTAEFVDASYFHDWLQVLACPRLYHEMTRKPTREHMLHIHDRYLPYARSKREHVDAQGYFVFQGDERLREHLASKIRELFETWSPLELPPALTETARALLEAEGIAPPEGGWDNVEVDQDVMLEEILLWPEGVPALLGQHSGGSGVGGGSAGAPKVDE